MGQVRIYIYNGTGTDLDLHDGPCPPSDVVTSAAPLSSLCRALPPSDSPAHSQESDLSVSNSMVVLSRLLLVSPPAFTALIVDAAAQGLVPRGGGSGQSSSASGELWTSPHHCHE